MMTLENFLGGSANPTCLMLHQFVYCVPRFLNATTVVANPGLFAKSSETEIFQRSHLLREHRYTME
jgi:hypothetical protein